MIFKKTALFLNCGTEQFVHVPFTPENYRLVIADTRKVRKLSDSKYNERRAECESSVEYLSKSEPVSFLGELSFGKYLDMQDLIPDETMRRRAYHVVSENQRVLDAVKALKDADLELFGVLMNASHDSLRDDYEVTGIELDTLVEESRKVEGVLGSRMTGAGFGGCTVSVVLKDATERFVTEVGSAYHARTGLKPDFYIGEVGEGAHEL